MTTYRDAAKKALEDWGCGCLDVEAALSVVENAIAGAGWCIAPLEPTEEMTHFGAPDNAEDAFNAATKKLLRVCGCRDCDTESHGIFSAIYRAMIDARPKE
jgi:hypothetical protein